MTTWIILGALFVLVFGGYAWHQHRKSNTSPRSANVMGAGEQLEATFAGGCFWCSESDFEKTVGVVSAVSGYTGGHVEQPTYNQVSAGGTGHKEAVRVLYDPAQVSYDQLLDVFWRHINPTDAGGQFADRGDQYASAIFYHDEDQRASAEASKAVLEASAVFEDPIVTPILPVETFYPAEDYHQDYHTTHATTYKYYRSRSGRDMFIEKTWGNGLLEAQMHGAGTATRCHDGDCFTIPPDDVLRAELTPLQYRVTQEHGTERAFDNPYWDNKEEGIYVDIVSGEPLFSSVDKYVSGTGWPSFTRPIHESAVSLQEDRKLFITRTEVHSTLSNSHVGHVFTDGPVEDGGMRYCMNSAAMRFIPKDELTGRYEEYRTLFDD